jgi:hypothetical protein
MTARRPASALRKVLAVLLPAVAGGVFGMLLARSGLAVPGVKETLRALSAWDLLALPLLILLVIAVHELGHVLGGLSRGMRFLLFIAGPIQVSRGQEGLRVNWVFNLGTFGGMAACIPDAARPLPPQLRRLVVGGPLASLLLTVLAGFAVLPLEGRAAAYALIVAALSATIFLVTAVPLRAGGFMSDGAQLLELLRGGKGVRERQRLVVLMGESMSGRRPAEWDPGLVAAALADTVEAEPLRRVAAVYYAYLHALDRGELAVATEHAVWLGEHVEDYPDGFRQALAVELALFEALYRRQREAATAWLGRARGGVVDASRRALAEAAVAALDGDLARRDQRLEQARRALRRGSDAGLNRLSESQIAQLATRSDARVAA